MKFILLASLLILPMLHARQETGFLNRSVKVQGTTYKYVVYLPPDYTKSKRWPVVLFLHGAGERGEDGLAQSQVGIGGAVRFHADRFPAVIVMPQCRKEVWWPDPAMEAQALAALDASIKEFKGDKSRVYLTGLSMGGYGTFALGAKHASRFAAMAPICGGVVRPNRRGVPQGPPPTGDPYAETAKGIGNKPIWIFHGAADPTVPVTESQKMRDAIKAAGGDPKYTEYPGVGHNSWDKAYNEIEFPKWLFSHSLQRKP
ncbi:MAG: dienelactone hydrolase family protein [Acidobacteria bacterium]|nr:dienelactone hydrolase family protein [Acidobacteriota bacterium]